MTREALLQLRERLAKATGPDRSIDQAIAVWRGWTQQIIGGKFCWAPPASGLPSTFPRYTASIDAAVTLVPEAIDWTLATRVGTSTLAKFSRDASSAVEMVAITQAKTPPLALCLARVEYELAKLDAATPEEEKAK